MAYWRKNIQLGCAQAQRETEKPLDLVAHVVLSVAVSGAAVEKLPLRLRPGPPAALRLLPGHPWASQAQFKYCFHHSPHEQETLT